MYKYVISDLNTIKTYLPYDEEIFGEALCFLTFYEAKKGLIRYLERKLEETKKLKAKDLKHGTTQSTK